MNTKDRHITATFIRHAESAYNVLGYCNDDPEILVELTPRGRKEASQVAKLLEKEFDEIIVSQFPRTQETAAILNIRNVPIIIDERLNDRRTGFEGRPVVEFHRTARNNPAAIRLRGGESTVQHKQRILSFLNALRRRPHNHVLVVTHHEPLRVVLGHVLGLDAQTSHCTRIGNCEGFTIELPRTGPIEGCAQAMAATSRSPWLGTYLSPDGTRLAHGCGTSPREARGADPHTTTGVAGSTAAPDTAHVSTRDR